MHKMNLWNDSFEAIKDGWETIEMRLNDEKRSLIKIGDEIEFTNVKTNELLICKVTHWSIESSHWLLDVQFNEDRHTARKDNAASNFSVLKRFVIALKDALKHSDTNFKKLTMHKFFIMNSFNFSKIEKMLFAYDVQVVFSMQKMLILMHKIY